MPLDSTRRADKWNHRSKREKKLGKIVEITLELSEHYVIMLHDYRTT